MTSGELYLGQNFDKLPNINSWVQKKEKKKKKARPDLAGQLIITSNVLPSTPDTSDV